jgi:hypothetical protein
MAVIGDAAAIVARVGKARSVMSDGEGVRHDDYPRDTGRSRRPHRRRRDLGVVRQTTPSPRVAAADTGPGSVEAEARPRPLALTRPAGCTVSAARTASANGNVRNCRTQVDGAVEVGAWITGTMPTCAYLQPSTAGGWERTRTSHLDAHLRSPRASTDVRCSPNGCAGTAARGLRGCRPPVASLCSRTTQ